MPDDKTTKTPEKSILTTEQDAVLDMYSKNLDGYFSN